jgi:ketosteroid isomerase-like protein
MLFITREQDSALTSSSLSMLNSANAIFEVHVRNTLALCLILTTLSSACNKGSAPDEMLAAADALDKKLVAASNKRDVDLYMETHWNSPKLTVLDETDFSHGWVDFKEALSTYFKGFSEFKFAFTESKNIVDVDLVLGEHKWSAEYTLLNGTKRIERGLHSDVKAVRDGKWVIISATWVKLHSKPEDMLKAVAALNAKGSEAFNKKDINSEMDTYWNSPDLVVVDQGLVVRGFDAWKSETIQQMQRASKGKFEITEAHSVPFGEIVLAWGRWQFKGDGKVSNGLYTGVKAMHHGKWVNVLEHYSEAAHPSKAALLPRKK